MNHVEFFDKIVLPTVDDFSKHPGDIRRGVLACLVLQAMNEHYYEDNKNNRSKIFCCSNIDDYKRRLRKDDWAFGQIMDIANGTKHVVLHRGPRAGDKPFHDLHLEVPAEMGILRAGFPLSSEPYVFVDADNAWLLYQLTEHVAAKWKELLI